MSNYFDEVNGSQPIDFLRHQQKFIWPQIIQTIEIVSFVVDYSIFCWVCLRIDSRIACPPEGDRYSTYGMMTMIEVKSETPRMRLTVVGDEKKEHNGKSLNGMSWLQIVKQVLFIPFVVSVSVLLHKVLRLKGRRGLCYVVCSSGKKEANQRNRIERRPHIHLCRNKRRRFFERNQENQTTRNQKQRIVQRGRLFIYGKGACVGAVGERLNQEQSQRRINQNKNQFRERRRGSTMECRFVSTFVCGGDGRIRQERTTENETAKEGGDRET